MDKDTKKMIEMYKAGNSTQKIAYELNCSRNKISRRLKKSGVKIRSWSEAAQIRSQHIEAKSKDIIKMYLDGYSTVDVGAEFGCSNPVIARILVANGVKIRNKKEAMALRRRSGSLDKYKQIKKTVKKRCSCCGGPIPTRPVDGVYLTRLCPLCWKSDSYEPDEFYATSNQAIHGSGSHYFTYL